MIELNGTLNKEVSFCKFDHAGTGLLSKVNGFEISYCIFRDSQCGFKAESVDSTFCSNLLCEEVNGETNAGIYFSQVENGSIDNNIVNNCENGMIIKDESSPSVDNNYIRNCNYSIYVNHNSDPNIYNNDIISENLGIWIGGSSFPCIQKNIINSEICIHLHNTNSTGEITINYNNLNCDLYVIELYGYISDINAENNYYYTINEDEINEIIFDKNDGPHPSYGEVDYQPFLTEEYPYAGIQDQE